jgi:putative oxidoreductase
MRIATIIVRILLGALYTFSAIMVLFNLMKQPEMTGNPKIFMEGMVASGYLMTLLKVTELLCGIALIVGLFAPLATVIIFPISLNILLYHVYIGPEGAAGIPVAIFILIANLFLAYAYREKYKPMLKMK